MTALSVSPPLRGVTAAPRLPHPLMVMPNLLPPRQRTMVTLNLLPRPRNNNACRGYVIYAMENCGFSPTDIRRVVAELHEVFDFCGLEEAQQHFENGPY